MSAECSILTKDLNQGQVPVTVTQILLTSLFPKIQKPSKQYKTLNVQLSCPNFQKSNLSVRLMKQDPDGEIKNSGKSIFEIRIPNFCYIQVIVFDLSYLPVAAVGTQQVRHEKKLKNRKDVFTFFHGSVLAKSQSLPLVDRLGQKL